MTKDMEFRISVTGDLGSGKSTVCQILAERMKAEIVSIGTINRKMAMEMNMDISLLSMSTPISLL